MSQTITPSDLLKLYLAHNLRPALALIDVRSPGEFECGSLPGFINLPILNNEERAKVGTCYKEFGQEKAIALGHDLVAKKRNDRVASWMKAIASSPSSQGIVHCWRGGLRSKISCQWIKEAGGKAILLQGGYKHFRRLLLEEISAPKSLVMLNGLTGSNKTTLLNEFPNRTIDLEGQARHRGSSFGLALGVTQPSQQNFENSMGLAFARLKGKTIFLEDESKLIGHRYLGNDLFQQMTKAPRIVLNVPLNERISNIASQYVIEPLAQGFALQKVREHLLGALKRLKKPLGSLLCQEVHVLLEKISDTRFHDKSAHFNWIELILTNYYDKAYRHAFKKNPKQIIFTGTHAECREFIKSYPSAAPKDE